MWHNLTFATPWAFLLLLLIPAMTIYRYRNLRRYFATLTMPTLEAAKGMRPWRGGMQKLLPVLRMLALAAFIVALARPQLALKEEVVNAEGIDIFLVLDLSSSMLAQDFKPDRLEVSKQVAAEFVDKRPYDRIGLAVFSGEAFTQCPLTTDHRAGTDFLESVRCGSLEDGTAIGMGLPPATNRLKDSQAKSKVVILLTDGVNNAGYVKPLTAAEIAQKFNVKVYTIGVGTEGEALTPVSRRSDGRYVFGLARVEIDEDLLSQISGLTGGKDFRATNENGLKRVDEEMDGVDKTQSDVTTFKLYS